MAGYRPARLRENSPAEDAIRKKIDAVKSLKAAGFQPGAFIIRGTPPSPLDLQAAVRQFFGTPDPRAKGISAHLYSLPRAVRPMTPPKGGVGDTVLAVGNGAIDSLPLGLGDHGLAAYLAFGDALHLRDPIASYQARLAAQEARNHYDEQYHPVARTAGKVAGTVAQLAVPGMALSRIAGGQRMAEAAPLIFKEGARLTGYGALAGVGAQGVGDVAHGRLSSRADYFGSAAGGGAGALTAIYGRPGLVGGVTGAATSLAQDVFNGRVRSWDDRRRIVDRAADAAAFGNLFSVPFGMHLAAGTHRLPSFRPTDGSLFKGSLGEWLSMQRTRLRGQDVAGVQVRTKVSGGHTVLDHAERGANRVEAKFGNSTKLRPRQREAYNEFSDYRVDHLMPKDLGAAAEVPSGALYYQEYDDDRR